MYPKLFQIPLYNLTKETGWVILILSAIFAFAFYYLAYLERKKVKSGATKLHTVFNTLFYISLLVFLISIFSSITGQRTLDFNSYGFMLAVVFVLGFYLTLWKAKRIGIQEKVLLDFFLLSLLVSMFGARLFFMLFEYVKPLEDLKPPFAFFYNPLDIFKISAGGLVAYGGFFTGTVFALYYIKKKALPLGKLADILAPTLALGVAFARMGCNLAGCCWGGVVDHDHFIGIPLSLFHSESPVFQYFINPKTSYNILTTYVWPAQLISSLNGFIMFLVLNFIYNKYHGRFKFSGFLFIIFMIYYSVTRFLIELIRVDTPKEFFGLSSAQFIGIFIFLFAIILMIYNFSRTKQLES